MKLLSVQLARSVLVFDTAEINTRGKNIFTDLVPKLVASYHFKNVPQEGGDFSKGIVLGSGTFTNSKHDPLQVGLTIWSDGIAADSTSSTNDADEFLESATGVLPGLGYRFDAGMVRRKTYHSQIIVQCRKSLSALNPQLDGFSKKLKEATGQQIDFGFAALEFWPDQTQIFKPVNFSFQRKTGDPFTGDRYWSQAGLPTDKHLELLDQLESFL